MSKLAGDWRGRNRKGETHKAQRDRSQTRSYIPDVSRPTNQLKTKASDSQDSELLQLGVHGQACPQYCAGGGERKRSLDKGRSQGVQQCAEASQ